MPGDGIRAGPIPAERPICLDVTRLVSRVGRGPHTGIDRVEQAYLEFFLQSKRRLFCLSRTAAGYVLLDREGAVALRARFDGAVPWGATDLIGKASRKLPMLRQRAEADLRRLAIRRSARPFLSQMLRKQFGGGAHYLNVGHSNLTARVLAGFAGLDGGSATVLMHDTIPVDFPEHHRAETVAAFEKKLQAVSAHATHVVANSLATQSALESWFAKIGRVPPIIMSHLGIDGMVSPEAGHSQAMLPEQPYFIAVGTVTPRKNPMLLLDLWRELGSAAPLLILAGSVDPVFEVTLQNALADTTLSARIRHLPDLPDASLSALVAGACAVLHPSFAEGFGFVPLEAALLGTPVICANLPVYREVLGDIGVYAEADDLYQWKDLVQKHLAGQGTAKKAGQIWAKDPSLLTWASHINTVLTAID